MSTRHHSLIIDVRRACRISRICRKWYRLSKIAQRRAYRLVSRSSYGLTDFYLLPHQRRARAKAIAKLDTLSSLYYSRFVRAFYSI